jgi:hypothetical protein
MKTPNIYRVSSNNRKHIWNRRIPLVVLASLLAVPLCAAQGTGCQSGERLALSHADADKTIYVSDFELDPNNFKQDKGGITGKGYLLPAPPKSFLRRKHQDPATAASNLVRLMSESLVADLQKAGFTARRLSSTEPRPTEGLFVTGVFTEMDEGNQMRRALLGFGSGKAKMDLYVAVTDVSQAEQPVYETSAQKGSRKAPGAVLAFNPYLGAGGFVVKFGMTKNAPEEMIKKTAAKITEQLTKQLTAEPSGVQAALGNQ